MSHRLELCMDEPYSGELRLGFHPDGSLEFEDGSAVVESEELAEMLADRYSRIERMDDPEIADLPFDPSEYTVGELQDAIADGDYSDAELRALVDAEEASKDRTSAIDAFESAIGD